MKVDGANGKDEGMAMASDGTTAAGGAVTHGRGGSDAGAVAGVGTGTAAGAPVRGTARASNLTDLLRREEDKLLACVHCGFCLPACPTYTRLGDEADSPRGRLYLMRAVAEGRISPDDDAFGTHLDRCLGCRACETVCPSGVEYGALLERARALIASEVGTHPATKLLLGVFGRRTLSRPATALGRLLRATGVARILARRLPRRFARARFALAMLAATEPAPETLGRRDRATGADGAGAAAELTAASGGVDGARSGADTDAVDARAARPGTGKTVALLTGCVQDGLFRRVNRATARVLRANGFRVVEAPGQGCCGALHAHAGELDAARELARRNIDAFDAAGADYIVVNAAGCGATMKEYAELLGDEGGPDRPVRDDGGRDRPTADDDRVRTTVDDNRVRPAADGSTDSAERARHFVARVRDLFELLAETDAEADAGLRTGAPLPLRVTYDAPCHLHHAQRVTDAPLQVLRTVPGLELVPLPDADECCGGAGIYGMLHPELGGRILDEKVAAVRSTGADAVVSPNPGCIMQIGAGLMLARDGRDGDGRDGDANPAAPAVLHPVELLDEGYRRAGFYDADEGTP
ncbi:MAG: (Fe-S)-binding protein [Gemmatimonadota bacterium]